MADEKPNKYEPPPNLPIPTYEEAIGSSSRTNTPRSPLDSEAAQPSERAGLLGPSSSDSPGRVPVPTRRAGYRPPPTEDGQSAHDDEDDERDTFLGQDTSRQRRRRDSQDSDDEESEVRREIEEMEYEEPPTPTSAWGKRISSLSASLSSIPWLGKLKFKPQWPSITADVCIMIGRGFAILLVMGVVYLLFVSTAFQNAATRMGGQMFEPESVRLHVQHQVNAQEIANYLQMITQTDHLAGTEGDYFLAQKVEGKFREALLEDVHLEEYQVYMNYPKEGGRKIELLNKDGSVKWKARIDEEKVYKEPPRQQTPVFHGYSKSGDVKGPLIYVNYGSREDYKVLFDSAIATKGAIALVRQGGSQTDVGMKVRTAQDWGFVGVIVYSDPADDGFTKGEVAPGGKFMPAGAVQRGSVSLPSYVLGDVLTPGWASTTDAKRNSKDKNPGLVTIPSIPISADDAKHLLEAIKGVEHPAPDGWSGGIEGMSYWIGNSTSPIVHLVNDQDESEKQKIWNVVGKITGIEQSEKSVIVGNRRDAWVYGASEPGSGTAVMLEVIRVLGELMTNGWRPSRSIEFISWGGGSHNHIGSTEHVEENIEKLRRDGYAYINLDNAVTGQEFRAAGSPLFKKTVLRALDRTSDPYQNVTLRNLWDNRRSQFDDLGARSDYTAFQDIAGVSSLDIGFHSPTHTVSGSAQDNLEWAVTVNDPDFQYHAQLAQIVALIILEFSNKEVAPFDIRAYSASILQWVMDLENWVANKGVNKAGQPKWDINPLREAAMQLANDARLFEKWEAEWDTVVIGGGGFETSALAEHRKSHNNRMANFDMYLLDLEEGGGLPNRTQYKHVIFGPSIHNSNKEAYFPSIRDAVEARDWALAQKQLEKVAKIIRQAGRHLVGNRV